MRRFPIWPLMPRSFKKNQQYKQRRNRGKERKKIMTWHHLYAACCCGDFRPPYAAGFFLPSVVFVSPLFLVSFVSILAAWPLASLPPSFFHASLFPLCCMSFLSFSSMTTANPSSPSLMRTLFFNLWGTFFSPMRRSKVHFAGCGVGIDANDIIMDFWRWGHKDQGSGIGPHSKVCESVSIMCEWANPKRPTCKTNNKYTKETYLLS